MMEASQHVTDAGRDTTMCGDPKAWYPMRVTYSRELKVKAELDRLEIENFVPMTYRLVDADGENPHRELLPAINNLELSLYHLYLYDDRYKKRQQVFQIFDVDDKRQKKLSAI